MKVVVIVGTRPQIIKAAPVVKAFNKLSGVECSIINTGQHYDYQMNKEFFKEFELPDPEIDLAVGAGTANEQISKIIDRLGKYFSAKKAEIAIIPGDTNSALASGIACSKIGMKIAHLESGCRSNDFRMSEEINRRVLDELSNVLLCPTEGCCDNLRAEGVLADVIENVGDTMLDSLIQFKSLIQQSNVMNVFELKPGKYGLLTLHRAENVDNPDEFKSILAGISTAPIPLVFPVHPRTRARIKELGIENPKNIKVIDPLPYFDMIRLIRDSAFVVTDSGGVQKEAFWLRKPSVIVRLSTEWNEIVDLGAAILAGSSREQISRGLSALNSFDKRVFEKSTSLFGDGNAANRVCETVIRFLNKMQDDKIKMLGNSN